MTPISVLIFFLSGCAGFTIGWFFHAALSTDLDAPLERLPSYEADSMYYSVRLGTTHWITPISWLYNQVPDGNMYYMPTITDLLSTLGEVVIRRILTPDGYFYTVAKNVGDDTEITSDYDLAEALALMWEKFNKQ